MGMTSAGFTVSKLAKKRGVSPQTIRDWLRMIEADMSGKHLVGICLDLGIAVIWMSHGIGSPTPEWLTLVRKERRVDRLTT